MTGHSGMANRLLSMCDRAAAYRGRHRRPLARAGRTGLAGMAVTTVAVLALFSSSTPAPVGPGPGNKRASAAQAGSGDNVAGTTASDSETSQRPPTRTLPTVSDEPTTPSSTVPDPSGERVPSTAPGGDKTLYETDFADGRLDPGWFVYQGVPASDPAGSWDPSHVSVSPGLLTERAYLDPLRYQGAAGDPPWVEGGVSFASASFSAGTVLVRSRLTSPIGVASTLLLWPSPSSTWPPEVDFSETTGTAQAYGFSHWGTSARAFESKVVAPAVDLTQWHTWGVSVTPSTLTFSVDGNTWATMPNRQPISMHLCMQQEIYGPGNSHEETSPESATPPEVDLDVAWVAIYVPAT